MHCAFDLNLASLSVSSLPRMFVCAFTSQVVPLWWEFFSLLFEKYISTVRVIRSLSWWLYWEEGFLI